VCYFAAVKKYLAAILISTLYCNARAQENWDTYMARIDGKPASILVDMGLFDKAPEHRMPFLVITGPRARNCSKDGIPYRDEIPELEEILDATTSFITGVMPLRLCGTYTHQCQRLNYYYMKDSFGVRTAIQRMYRRNFKDRDYVLNIRYDPEWRTYLTFLYPTDGMKTWMENEKIMMHMLQNGDSLTAARDIIFEAAFPTDSITTVFTDFLRLHGYDLRSTEKLHSRIAANKVVFYRHAKVNIDTLNTWTGALKQEIDTLGGIYNGWTAPVKR